LLMTGPVAQDPIRRASSPGQDISGRQGVILPARAAKPGPAAGRPPGGSYRGVERQLLGILSLMGIVVRDMVSTNLEAGAATKARACW
jgi:hypothetical protein